MCCILVLLALFVLDGHAFIIPSQSIWKLKCSNPHDGISFQVVWSRLQLFGGIFGDEARKTVLNNNNNNNDDLALYPALAKSDSTFDALSEYLQQWGKLFEGKGMGLTTPVTVQAVTNIFEENENVVKAEGVRIVFLKVQNGYRDKDEEEELKKDRDNVPKKDAKQGGVQIMVEQMKDGSVQVRARRCEMDDNTIIKEMSEETILKELKKAMNIWKKESK